LVSITGAGIVFTTLATCGSEQLRKIGKFDFILINKAGQATEPEALIPLESHFEPKIALLLVGDTQQSLVGTSLFAKDAEKLTGQDSVAEA
jgi:superfamily I DNA and/or RNA helicase